MADLDFSHHVAAPQQGESLPTPYHKSVAAEISDFPNIQGAVENYADSANWMSAVGSKIAATASNQLATQLGAEAGKNPNGDIGLPITDFDKTMQESYARQSQATLGLQADKLITDSNIEMAKVPRLTPDMIQKTNKSVSSGLQNIFKNAPSSVQPELYNQFGQLQLRQTAELTNRMIGEQKDDQRNNTAYASDMNAQHAYSFAVAGNEKAAKESVENTKKINNSAVSARLMTPEQSKTNIDSARKSYESGKLINQYEKARSENKGEEFLKNIADKGDKSDPDFQDTTSNLMNYISHQESLRSQDQQLRIAKFSVDLAKNPMDSGIGKQLQDLKQNVTPVAFEKAQLSYIDAIKSYNKENGDVNSVLSSWNDPSSFARLNEKAVNKGFDILVNGYRQRRESEGNPISQDEAEVQVASSAGGNVPVFNKSLQNKLLSGNPNSIISASQQMSMLDDMEQARVYAGVSQKAKAIGTLFQQQRGSMPDVDLARQITDNLSNVDDKMQKTLDNSWNLILTTKGAAGIGASKPLYKFALQSVGYPTDSKMSQFGGQYFGVIYGNDIYNQLNSNFIATRGDYDSAVKMTKDYVAQHYGDTYINGSKQITDSPIEKYLGYKGNGVTPYVQQDMLNQLSTSFNKSKKNNPNDYWETLPLKNNIAEVIRTVNGKKFTYPVNLVGRAGNQWDVVVQTPYGNRNIFLVAPNLGVTSYVPNKEAINMAYAAHKKKGWF